jgi:hypothetical protein
LLWASHRLRAARMRRLTSLIKAVPVRGLSEAFFLAGIGAIGSGRSKPIVLQFESGGENGRELCRICAGVEQAWRGRSSTDSGFVDGWPAQ